MAWPQDQPREGGGGVAGVEGTAGQPDEQAPEVDQNTSGVRGARSPVVAEPRTLHTSEARGTAVGQAWVWIGVLIAVTVLAGLAVMRYRRSVLGAATAEGGESVLEMLRRARDRGEMTEEEFQSARRKLVGEMASKMKSGGRAG